MLTYCLKCKKDAESVDLKVIKTKNDRTMFLSKYAVCSSNKSRLIKEQEAKRLLSISPLSKVPLSRDILF